MDREKFRDELSLWLLGLFVVITVFTIHTYAAFSHTAPDLVYTSAALLNGFEVFTTCFLVGFISNRVNRPIQCLLMGVAALMPCLLVWILGTGLAWWPLAWWTFSVAFWGGYATEVYFGPLSYTIDALYALGTRLQHSRHQPATRRARGLSQSPPPQHSYAFTELSSSPTLNGSPQDVPGTPVQAAGKDTDSIV